MFSTRCMYDGSGSGDKRVRTGKIQRTHIIMVIIIDNTSGRLTSALRPPKAESSRPYDIQVHREIAPAVGRIYTILI